MADEPVSYIIQYDGLTLEENTIELGEFGESLQGFSKILGSAGTTLLTGQVVRKYSDQKVTVSTSAKSEAGCIEIPVLITQNFDTLFSGFAGSALSAIVAYVISKRKDAEMEHLVEALRQSMEHNERLVDKFLAAIEKMTRGMSPAISQALAPIGKSCSTVSLLDSETKKPFVTADKDLKEFFEGPSDQPTLDEERDYLGCITELDRVNWTCKVHLSDSEDGVRIAGNVVDPAKDLPQNAYIKAFASGEDLNFRAKAQLSKDNAIERLYISDATWQQ